MGSNARAGSSPAFCTDEKLEHFVRAFLCSKLKEIYLYKFWHKKTLILNECFSQNDLTGLIEDNSRLLYKKSQDICLGFFYVYIRFIVLLLYLQRLSLKVSFPIRLFPFYRRAILSLHHLLQDVSWHLLNYHKSHRT